MPVARSPGLWERICRLAGAIGIDPGPLTYRELVWMAEGRDRHAWRHTSEVLAMILNVNRADPKARLVRASDLDPYAARDGRQRQEAMPVNSKTLPILVARLTGKGRRKVVHK